MSGPESRPLLGVDVGGTTLRVGAVVGEAVVWEHRHVAHLSRHLRGDAPSDPLAFVVDALVDAIRPGVARYPDAAGVGLAIPGFLEPATGRLAHSPNLPGLADVDLARPVAERLGLPVVAENDALAAAWGEHRLHPEAPESLLYVGLGTGVGGGLVLEGRPYRGRHGFAMEVGHVIVEPGGRACGCGNRGCLERYASATGVRASYEEATGEGLEAPEIAARARAGDDAARAAYARAGGELGGVLAHLLKVLDVPHVVVGGGLSSAWDLLEPALGARLEPDLLPVLRGRARVRASTSGDQAGMLGAALLSRDAEP